MTNKFAERCKELSDGAITVQTVAAGTLGSAREVVEACQLNSVNMIWAADSELDQVVGNLSWAWLPYTVTNYEQADEYYNEGWIDEAIAEICAEAGITCEMCIRDRLITVGCAVFFGFRGDELAVILLCGATPVATTAFSMAQVYNSDYELTGQLVVTTSLMSCPTLFVWIFALKQLHLI